MHPITGLNVLVFLHGTFHKKNLFKCSVLFLYQASLLLSFLLNYRTTKMLKLKIQQPQSGDAFDLEIPGLCTVIDLKYRVSISLKF